MQGTMSLKFEFLVTLLWEAQILQEEENWDARWVNQKVSILICEKYDLCTIKCAFN